MQKHNEIFNQPNDTKSRKTIRIEQRAANGYKVGGIQKRFDVDGARKWAELVQRYGSANYSNFKEWRAQIKQRCI